MNRRHIIALVLAASCLTGCYEIHEEVWLHPDRSGRFKFGVIFYGNELYFDEEEGKTRSELIDTFMDDFWNEMETKKEKIGKLPFVESVAIDQDFYEGTMHYFVYDIHVTDVTKLDDIYQEICRGRVEDETVWKIDIRQGPFGRFVFTQVFTDEDALTGKDDETEGGAEDDDSPEDRETPDDTWQDRSYKITLHAPQIISSNGFVDDQRKIAVWEMDILNPEDFDEFRAVVQLSPVRRMGILSAVLIICILGIGVWGLRKRRVR
jgi:hypothetical protein